MNYSLEDTMLNKIMDSYLNEFTNTLQKENQSLLEKNKKLYRKVQNQKRLILRLKNMINTNTLDTNDWDDITSEINELIETQLN